VSDPRKIRFSFSAARRWAIRLDYALRTVLVLAVAVMVNYLAARWYVRVPLSAAGRQPLSALTTGLLRSLTNDVRVILYYDPQDPFLTTIQALLREYQNVNPRIRVSTVDNLWEAGEAQRIKSQYAAQLIGITNKNLVIFDCEGRVKVVPGNVLVEYTLELDQEEGQQVFRRKPVLFLGEKMFTAALLAVTSPRALKVCYLIGHGEHHPDDAGESGYLKFAALLRQNYLEVQPVQLLGTNAVPPDCALVVVAGPVAPLSQEELERLDDYVRQGGRALVLLNFNSLKRPTGLENWLAGWGVDVGRGTITDPARSVRGSDIVIENFGQRPHPIMKPLLAALLPLHLILPRPVGRLNVPNPPADAPRVEELAFTSAAATLSASEPRRAGPFSVAVAVEKGRVPGVVSDRGSTRLVVVGDSWFLTNHQIESAGNRDFLNAAVNWLLDRPQLLEGVGPRPITEFRVAMTRSEFRMVQWILLAGLPGAVLLLGGLVWLRRRR
jgi:hypothetical protein